MSERNIIFIELMPPPPPTTTNSIHFQLVTNPCQNIFDMFFLFCYFSRQGAEEDEMQRNMRHKSFVQKLESLQRIPTI